MLVVKSGTSKGLSKNQFYCEIERTRIFKVLGNTRLLGK